MYAPVRLAAGSPDTIVQYECGLNVLADYAACEVTLDQLSVDLVEGFVAWYMRSGRGGAYTCNKNVRQILALWRFAMRKREIPFSHDPALIEMVPTLKRQPRTWTLEQFDAILLHASQAQGELYGIPVSQLLPAVLLTVYFTGLRIAALMQLQVADLDLERGWLNVAAELQKHKSEQRWRLPQACLQAIAATKPADRAMLFGGPLPGADRRELKNRLRNLGHRLKKVLAAAGLPNDRRCGFHCVRRLSATQIARVAGDAAATAHLGHSSGTLLQYYVDRSQVDRPEAADLLPAPTYQPPATPA